MSLKKNSDPEIWGLRENFPAQGQSTGEDPKVRGCYI